MLKIEGSTGPRINLGAFTVIDVLVSDLCEVIIEISPFKSFLGP